MKAPRIVIFASGTGSNAEALMQKMKDLQKGPIEFVLSDRREATVIEKALHLGVMTYLVEKTGDRISHEVEILKLIDRHQVDWIFLAGYMRLLSADFLKAISLRHGNARQVVNIHPSLLPQYPGTHALERAFADQVTELGVTLHCVDEGMDTGPILAQEKVQLKPHETFSDLKARIHAIEHKMYTQLLEQIIDGKIQTKFFKEVVEC